MTDAFALKQPATDLTAHYKAQRWDSNKQWKARCHLQIHTCFENLDVTKFLIAAEVFLLIPFNTTHLQGSPKQYQSL